MFFTIVTVCNNFLWTFFEYLVILLDFLFKIDYYMNKLLDKLTEVQVMNFKKNFGWIIAIVAGTVAIASAVTAFLIFKDKKKKDEEELEHYLDCSIQRFIKLDSVYQF